MAESAPADVLRTIFATLDTKSLLSCAATCHRWRNAINLNQIWVGLLPRVFIEHPASRYGALTYRELVAMRAVTRTPKGTGLLPPFFFFDFPFNPLSPHLPFWWVARTVYRRPAWFLRIGYPTNTGEELNLWATAIVEERRARRARLGFEQWDIQVNRVLQLSYLAQLVLSVGCSLLASYYLPKYFALVPFAKDVSVLSMLNHCLLMTAFGCQSTPFANTGKPNFIGLVAGVACLSVFSLRAVISPKVLLALGIALVPFSLQKIFPSLRRPLVADLLKISTVLSGGAFCILAWKFVVPCAVLALSWRSSSLLILPFLAAGFSPSFL